MGQRWAVQRGWKAKGLFSGSKAPVRLGLKCGEQITLFSYFQDSPSRMTSETRSETVEGEYYSEIQYFLSWVPVSHLYPNAFVALGVGITYSHICTVAS